MNRPMLDKLTQAVLYEGYILYPYRPSVKNQQRWNFGGLFPETWNSTGDSSDPCRMQMQCLIHGAAGATLEIAVRFLHLINRSQHSFCGPSAPRPWQESVEREVDFDRLALADLLSSPRKQHFRFSHCRKVEPLQPDDPASPSVVREQQPIEGVIALSACTLAADLHQLTAEILNTTPLPEKKPAAAWSRDDALLRSFASTHMLLGIAGAEFLSLTDPPEMFRAQAAGCNNIGCWPILAGQPPARDTLLASPIILPDYPQLAPESPGDLFDSSEIDEILTLRILTLTDEEKRAAAALDPCCRALLQRTESLAREQLANLHGAVRSLQPMLEEQRHD